MTICVSSEILIYNNIFEFSFLNKESTCLITYVNIKYYIISIFI